MNAEVDQSMPNKIPSKFIWTLMSSNVGEPLENIIRRKNLERRSGQDDLKNIFWWGVSQNKGPAIFTHLADHIPEVFFSTTLDEKRPSGLDEKVPSGAQIGECFLWTTYRIFDEKRNDYGLESFTVPKNIIVISGQRNKRSNYALVCRSRRSVRLSEVIYVRRRQMQNLNNDRNVGKFLETSQQTFGVVQHVPSTVTKVTNQDLYPIEMRANLAFPCFVKLEGATLLNDSQRHLLEEVGRRGRTVDDYLYVVSKIRK